MPSEKIHDYTLEYEGIPLRGVKGWGAFVTIYGPSRNPMHRHAILPTRHVSVEKNFPTQQAAQDEAHRVALEMMRHRLWYEQ